MTRSRGPGLSCSRNRVVRLLRRWLRRLLRGSSLAESPIVGTFACKCRQWEILRGWIPAIVFAAIAVAIELLYYDYMIGRGLANESFDVSLGIVKIPLSIA